MKILCYYIKKGKFMERTKKILMISSLSCLAAACLMLILAVFGVPVFKGIQLRVLLVLSTFAIACGLAIGELSVIQKNFGVCKHWTFGGVCIICTYNILLKHFR